MATIVITGSASGIGAATRALLEEAGETVVGVDRRDAEVVADLGSAAGRAAAVAAVLQLSEGVVDGVVVAAGVGPQTEPLSTIVSVNYFGAQVFLAGLRDALERADAPAAVAISSNSAALPGMDTSLVAACLAGDEALACDIARALDGPRVYGGTKLALTRWLRRSAPGTNWAGSGIRLNAVAPGAVRTPLLQEGLNHPLFGPAINAFPIPTGEFGDPEEIAPIVAFLLSTDASYFCGSVVFVDGGTDALLRPDTF